jgi:hypothetical protein
MQTQLAVGMALFVLVWTVGSAADAAATPPFAFSPQSPGFFSFDTGAIKGVVRADNASEGIVELTDCATGQNVIKEQLPGIFSLYRAFSAGRRFADARSGAKHAELNGERTQVIATWEASNDFPLTIRGVFSIPDARSIDLELVCTPKMALPSFELFVSSYIVQTHRHFVFLKNTLHQAPAPAPVLFEPVATPFIEGCYLAFPRDADACRLIFDGRWQRPANPVQFALGRHYAVPLMGSRNPDSGLSVLLFMRPQDCFALESTYARPGEPDSVASHNSLYFSLGGADLEAGANARFILRATVAKLTSHDEALTLYKTWLEGAGK